jgi:predicted nucleotidyltransferase
MAVRAGSQVEPVCPAGLSCVLRWPSEAAWHWTVRLVHRAIEDDHIDAVIAIGSSVRLHAATSSDVDLVVIYHGEKPGFGTPPIDVDVRSFRRDEVDALISDGNDLLGWTVRYGQLVYERDNFWSDVETRWAGRIPLPSATASLARASKAQRRVSDLLQVGDEDAALEQVVTMLTHTARARLIEASVYPASRPELPGQLASVGECDLASLLTDAIRGSSPARELLQRYGDRG